MSERDVMRVNYQFQKARADKAEAENERLREVLSTLITAVMRDPVDPERDYAKWETTRRDLDAAVARAREILGDEMQQDHVARYQQALAKADAEVAALADGLRAAGVAAPQVQDIINNAVPRGRDLGAAVARVHDD